MRKKSARSGSLYFYKWTLKGNGKSDVNVREFLYAKSSFSSIHAHFQYQHTSQLYFCTHSLQRAALYIHSQAAGGVKGISTVVVEQKIGILVIQTFHRSRASLEAEKNVLV